MKADRLLSILLLLQTRERISHVELAERMEVSVRTVYRDVEALSAAGVPVWTERGRSGGVRLLPGYRTDVTGLTNDEARALFVLATEGTHDALGLGEAIRSALRKVMAALPAPHRGDAARTSERILVDPVRWMHGTETASDAHLAELQHAAFTDRRLQLTYRSGDAREPRSHTVDPYGLVSKAGIWYLVADRDGEPRLFRADRVLAAAVTDEPVHRRPGQNLASVWALLRERFERLPDGIRVRCRVRREQLDVFQRLFTSQLVAPPRTTDGGCVRAELAFRELPDVRGLLSLGAAVEVLDPPEARAELAAVSAELAALYDVRA
ncbi:DeoR faimly transcriptional regulator [Streptomyces viridochromogenes]|uniref:DeoR faimly transcriptional regulator n=1 Tax=Streptomyces viridochromogenes TaxID=1938 RepID=A0A0J8CCU4_STRVR|nr:WYL domain-containing protein [Streptomyces viridochromogenes]KMS75700.1 DeoR faimly transcriptional regulator [Streptomyces viridochromogenes]KOG07038.1 DeoR faimly transcriptional regulator [Streptomyces viridochromogenes]KOG16902.1 DeoR faimly transcriptional regulator [Streptomyces viridochromogenes]